eukprot:1276825-Pyramimonas_sp.AAC.1
MDSMRHGGQRPGNANQRANKSHLDSQGRFVALQNQLLPGVIVACMAVFTTFAVVELAFDRDGYQVRQISRLLNQRACTSYTFRLLGLEGTALSRVNLPPEALQFGILLRHIIALITSLNLFHIAITPMVPLNYYSKRLQHTHNQHVQLTGCTPTTLHHLHHRHNQLVQTIPRLLLVVSIRDRNHLIITTFFAFIKGGL